MRSRSRVRSPRNNEEGGEEVVEEIQDQIAICAKNEIKVQIEKGENSPNRNWKK